MGCGRSASTSVEDLVKINSILRKEGYKNTSENNVVSSELRLHGENFTLQHDNNPKHTTRICRDYLQKNKRGQAYSYGIPSQLPDLNPAELLWDELNRKVKQATPTSTAILWSLLQKEWNTISEETLRELVGRMP
ncbi:hypothetical protein Trydic_g3457 [Trypoxylus dichotomus]